MRKENDGEVYFTFNESEPQENTYTYLPLIMNDGESEPRPTLTQTPELINPPDPIQGKIAHCNIYGDVEVCASASNSILSQYSNVTVYRRLAVNGPGQAGETMHTTWLRASGSFGHGGSMTIADVIIINLYTLFQSRIFSRQSPRLNTKIHQELICNLRGALLYYYFSRRFTLSWWWIWEDSF